MAEPKKGVVPGGLFLVGTIGLATLTLRPSFAGIRTVDFVQILASGMCFGVGLLALVQKLRTRSE